MKTNTMAMLDKISSSIEATVKTLQQPAGASAAPAKKRMTLDEFAAYAQTQIAKAAKEQAAPAKRRLAELKRNVDQVAASVSKLNAEDLDSESISVEVTTAYAPSGGTPIEGLTTAPDQSSTEVSLTSIGAGNGNTNFAENLNEVAKAIEKMKAELARAPGKPDKSDTGKDKPGRAAASKSSGDVAEPGRDWPLDLNSPSFREGVQKAEDAPSWGYDPDEVGSPRGG